jgi:hypothetical protein
MNFSRLMRVVRRRCVRCIGLTLAVLATLAALFYAEENWRGARSWARVKAVLEARGEPLRWENLLQTVPAEENFWAAAVIRERLAGSTQERYPLCLGFAYIAGWDNNESNFDLSAALRWLRDSAVGPLPPETGDAAADILAALAPAEPALAAMQEAANRPRAEPLPDQLSIQKMMRSAPFMMDTVRLYSLRTHALLAAGRRQEACGELVRALKLSRKLCSRPPTLMDLLIGLAVTGHPVAMVRDTEGRVPWNSQELENLETELSALNVINPFAGVLRSERAYMLSLLDSYPGNSVAVFGRKAPVLTRLFPSNWTQLSKAAVADAIQQRIDGIEKHGMRVEADRHIETAWFPLGNPHLATVSIMRNCLGTQAEIEIARIAIAAGRYRLTHGHPPASLAELTPLFPAGIPEDPITGAAFEYSQTSDGTFTVTSRGKDAGSPDDDTQWRIAPPARDAVPK